jgi:hypothetical protein
MISILNSDAYANYLPVLDGGATHPGPRKLNPTAALLKTGYQKSNPKQPVNGNGRANSQEFSSSSESITRERRW